jgi:hypothetical protein
VYSRDTGRGNSRKGGVGARPAPLAAGQQPPLRLRCRAKTARRAPAPEQHGRELFIHDFFVRDAAGVSSS